MNSNYGLQQYTNSNGRMTTMTSNDVTIKDEAESDNKTTTNHDKNDREVNSIERQFIIQNPFRVKWRNNFNSIENII